MAFKIVCDVAGCKNEVEWQHRLTWTTMKIGDDPNFLSPTKHLCPSCYRDTFRGSNGTQ